MIDAHPSIRLIAIDIDGTLLNPQGEISIQTRLAIREAQQAGIIITLATARRYNNTLPFANELDISVPLILYDGALIIQHPAHRVLATNLLPIAVARQAVAIMIEQNIQPIVQHIIAGQEEVWTGPQELDNPEVLSYLSRAFTIKRMDYAQLTANETDPLRVVAFTNDETASTIAPHIAALDCAWNRIKKGSYGSAELDVRNKTCSKASGVAALAHSLHIPMTEVMAIGDNVNDREMLQSVGWGVAMGQAPETIKAIADAVTTSNSEDGVAHAIRRYALPRSDNAASKSLKR
jgi:5-amino-6-(5-phospho-D-ribitylamino)uracil phosphatase